MDVKVKDETKVLVMTAIDKDELWSEILGSGYEEFVDDWVYSIEFLEGSWEHHGVVQFKYEDPETGEPTSKTLTIIDIANAVSDLTGAGWSHCGGDGPLDDPDACVGDAVIQQALFGELIFG